MRKVHGAGFLIAVMALSPRSGLAQAFEGTVTVQRITADAAAVRELVHVDEETDFDAETVFDVPIPLLVDLASRMEEDVDISRLIYSIKGQRMRVDGIGQSSEEGYGLIDYGSGVIRLVNPIEEIYIEWGEADIQELRSMFPAAEGDEAEPGSAPEVGALGEWRDVNGMACEMYRIETARTVTATCVAPDLSYLIDIFEEFEARMAALELIDDRTDQPEVTALIADKGFPVIEQTLHRYDEFDGVDYEVSEIVSVERKVLADELFELPRGYEKRGLIDMFRGGHR